jgi:hypothetical protein
MVLTSHPALLKSGKVHEDSLLFSSKKYTRPSESFEENH